MSKINILDCTLRDGGYVNGFTFEDAHIYNIINNLQQASIDIVECGFLDGIDGRDKDFTRFDRAETINKHLKKLPEDHNSLFVGMIEFGKFNIDDLPELDDSPNQIKGIRLSFHKSDYLKIFEQARSILAKGYELFIQPISTERYTDRELLELIHRCNELDIYAMYIVDTHGSMMRDNLRRIYYLMEHNVDKSIRLGFHSHNNLQLSYSNAMDFIEIAQGSQREIILDSSIYGMGRGAGNLNTELLADYINKRIAPCYEIEPLLEVVDEYLVAISRETRWGYSLEHFLSASERCHPNYASFLINKKNLSIVEIRKLLASIPDAERQEINKALINNIYINYKESRKLPVKKLPKHFFRENIALLASGKTSETHCEHILNKITAKKLKVVSLNHINHAIPADYVFFSNQVRYDDFCDFVDSERLIVTSNIKVRSNHENCYVLDYKELYELGGLKVDNAAILAMNLLLNHGVKEVSMAGLDGYDMGYENSYSYTEYNRVTDKETLQKINDSLAKSIELISRDLHISFLTPSQFRKHAKQKVIGVIPSRFASTRLPGKPLKDIAGLPMVIHVLKRAQMSALLDEVIVATDDQRIFDLVESYGGKAMLTDLAHNNGSERMYEVSRQISGDIFVVINGDEALLQPEHIDAGVRGLIESETPVSLLYNTYQKKHSPSDFKVVLNRFGEIMYISRSDIPSDSRSDVPCLYKAYHIMSYTSDFLETYMGLEQTPLDRHESHELLRVLENGYKIKAVEVDSSAISVDTQEDLEYVRSLMYSDPIFKLYGEMAA